MTEMEPSPAPPVIGAYKAPVQPGFAGALRGIWLLTWSNQMTWRRLPTRLATLLVLPFLVYITTKSPEAWERWHSQTAHVVAPLNRLYRRLQQSHSPLEAQQKLKLSKIFEEEYGALEAEVRAIPADVDGEQRSQRQHQAVLACAARIQSRAPDFLDDAQKARFNAFVVENQKYLESALVTRPVVWNRQAPFYHWLVDVYFFIVLPLTCVRGCGALLRDELQADTLGFLVTRPVSRARLVCVKYLSQLAWLEMLLLVETLLLFAVGAEKQMPDLAKLMPLFVAVQLLAVPAWSALGILLGQLTNRYMAIALLYGGIVELGIGRIPTNINMLSLMRHLKTLLSYNGALQSVYNWPTDSAWLSILALAIAPVLFLSLAAALFTFLEYLPSSEMQK